MTLADELRRRIEIKKQLVILTEEEIAELELRLIEEESHEI